MLPVESAFLLNFLGEGGLLLNNFVFVDALLDGEDGHRVLDIPPAEVDVKLDLAILWDSDVFSRLPHFVEEVGGGLEEAQVAVALHLVFVDGAVEGQFGILNMREGDEEDQLLVLVEGELHVDVEVAFLDVVVDGEVLFVWFGEHGVEVR